MKVKRIPFFTRLSAVLCFCVSFSVSGGKLDDIAQKARTVQNKEIIKCSPDGSIEGTVSLEKAVENLKSGTTLHLLPGYYNPQTLIMLKQDNLIIEGDGSGGECHFQLIAHGKNCIVRNIYLRSLEGGDITVVDSKMRGIAITNGGQKVNALIFNSCVMGLSIYANKSDITIAESTIFNPREPTEKTSAVQTWRYGTTMHNDSHFRLVNFGNIEIKGDVTFERCIIYSGSLILGNCVNGKSLELIFDNNLIFGKKGLLIPPGGKDAKEKIVSDFKGLKDFFSVKLKGDNILKQPLFDKASNPKADFQLYTQNLTLAKASPEYDKGLGANMGPGNMPVPREKSQQKSSDTKKK
ncbi:MAG: hypothetical protein A2017_02050 [Lentisphaerae bacterium GWF2_44_16]|nr:MAG: hypothetical protein A2017_02050 [Lentisphaerae bacterium GWF2_44_16]